MNHRSTLLLEHHLKELKLPSFLREYGKLAAQCAASPPVPAQAGGTGTDRHQRMVERRIRAARFPAVKSRTPSTSRPFAEQVPGDGVGPLRIHQRRENIIAVGNSGTGKTHVAHWVWPPASAGCQWASPRQPPWCTS